MKQISFAVYYTHTWCLDNHRRKKKVLITIGKGAQIFKKCRSHLKILGARRVTWCKFHIKDSQTLDMQNVVAIATWHLGFVHSL